MSTQRTVVRHRPRRGIQLRGTVSLLAGLTFLILVSSGLALYIAPRGRVANWSGWALLGLEKEQWAALHMTLGLLFLVAIACHLFFNWKILMSYIRRRSGERKMRLRELLLALGIVAICIAGTLLEAPGFREITRLNEAIKERWEPAESEGATDALRRGQGLGPGRRNHSDGT